MANVMADLTYWQKRALWAKTVMLAYVDAYNKDLVRLYGDAMTEIDRKLAEWFGRFYDPQAMNYQTAQFDLTADELARFKRDIQYYIEDGESMDYSGEWRAELERLLLAVRVSRLTALQTHIYQRLEEIYAYEKGTLDNLLLQQYTGMYYRTAYNWQDRRGQYSAIIVDENAVREILETPWANDGVVYFDRIWINKEKLKKTLTEVLAQALILGRAYGLVAQEVFKKINSAQSNAVSIVETESTHFQQVAQKDLFDLYLVEKVRILATLDLKTCEHCASLDGTIVDQKDNIPGVTTPQFHPNCRCTTEEVYEVEYRNPITGERTVVKDYADWYERFVKGVTL